ncbi:MAG: hypothetical protein R3253_01665 [Longimicrobiales bacterium]|nr:hypothetical protein [Longimicrobiales bacterium]
MTDEKTIYRERSPWPGWVGGVYWGSVALVACLLAAGYDTELSAAIRLPLAMGLLGLGWILARLIGGLTVLVQETRLYLYLGSYPVIKRTVPYGEILGMECREYRPIAEFGGWGVRGMGKKKAWTARGTRALVLTLTGDRELYVGSDHPQRLEERIRTVAGDQLGGPVSRG